jgi:hypothetical protein
MSSRSHHLVGVAVPLAHEPGARHGPAIDPPASHGRLATVELVAEPLQALDGLALQAAKSELLDAVGQPGFEEAAVEGWGVLAEEVAPTGDTFRSSLMIGAASEPAPAPGPSCPSLRPTSRG